MARGGAKGNATCAQLSNEIHTGGGGTKIPDVIDGERAYQENAGIKYSVVTFSFSCASRFVGLSKPERA